MCAKIFSIVQEGMFRVKLPLNTCKYNIKANNIIQKIGNNKDTKWVIFIYSFNQSFI